MRLIGFLKSETESCAFCEFLRREGIESIYEPGKSSDTAETGFTIWIKHEEDIETATQWLETFKKNPQDPRFEIKIVSPSFEGKTNEPKISEKRTRPPSLIPMTRFTILICIFFFIWDFVQQKRFPIKISQNAKIIPITDFESKMLYDYPERFALMKQILLKYPALGKEGESSLPPQAMDLYIKMQQTPFWQGYYSLLVGVAQDDAPMTKEPSFKKIKEGQLWRLISPSFMHGNLLHILFNMLWAYILGKQVEERIGSIRYIILILLTAALTNTAQYLVSGPFFLGYSGVIAGFVGFIYIRQKIAPWEGYPLHPGVLLFLAVFIISMALFQGVVFFLQLFGVTKLPFNLGNTAHVLGALFGMLCAKIPLFSKEV